MPTLFVDPHNPTDIIAGMEILASLLANHTVDEKALLNLTNILQAHLARQALAQVSENPYDEPVTHTMLAAMAHAWPETNVSFTKAVAKHGQRPFIKRLHSAIDEVGIPIGRTIYKGHFSHSLTGKVAKRVSISKKEQDFTEYLIQQWSGLSLPEDWIPPDYR